MRRLFQCLVLCCVGFPWCAEAVQSRLNTGIHYRQDELKWSIGLGDSTPNILSELTWERVQGVYFTADQWVIFTPGKGWQETRDKGISAPLFRFSGGYEVIVDGDNQDSDFAGNDRAGEWSRSNNEVSGDGAYDLAFSGGWHFRTRPRRGMSTASSWMLGYSFHSQKYNIVNGRQTVSNQELFDELTGQVPGAPDYRTLPPVGTVMPDLDSSYTAEWDGPFVGVLLEQHWADAKGNPRMRLYAGGQYHWVNYRGEGVWNLRGDLAQTPSFRHTAEARGWDASVGLDYNLSNRASVGVEAGYGRWVADEDGLDQTFSSNGFTGVIMFNEARWDVKTLGVKFNWEF